MTNSYAHFSLSLNGGRALADFRKSDPIALSCEKCGARWFATKQAYMATPKCKRCAALDRSVLKSYPQLTTYSSDDFAFDTPLSGRIILASCPTCGTWFKKSIASFAKDFSQGVDPCGKCAPRHRVKNGIVFLRNYPEFADRLLTELPDGRDDLPLNTSEKFRWRKGCGHEEYCTPLDFIGRHESCLDCFYPYRNLNEAKCSDCGEVIFLSRGDKVLFHSDPEGFSCAECRKARRIELNSLRDRISGWKRISWSKANSEDLDSLSASSAKRVLWDCVAKSHRFERFVYASEDSCPRCDGSSLEQIVELMIASYRGKILRNDRRAIAPLELDFYFPEAKLAIEVNGVYWHAESRGAKRDVHSTKHRLCAEKGIQLLTLWEDDILDKPSIVKSLVLHKLGISEALKLSARKCSVRSIEGTIARGFMEEHHIQGHSRSTVHYGLFFEEELVAAMSFRLDGSSAELSRFATAEVVRGGFSKLLKAFLREHPAIKRIKSFSDNSVSDGSIYRSHGFVRDGDLKPDYSYLISKRRKHKFNYRISRFRSDPELKFEEGLSESELAKLNGIDKIWDCGKVRWVLTI